jgi:hypothetical protein
MGSWPILFSISALTGMHGLCDNFVSSSWVGWHDVGQK